MLLPYQLVPWTFPMDKITKEKRSANMQAIHSKNTVPELTVRKLLHSLGYRYRLHRKDLPGKPDLVFPSRKKVIFINGCFWHQHSDCKKSKLPKSNSNYWIPKLERNKQRDLITQANLASLGWSSIIIWECEIKDVANLLSKVIRFLDLP